MARGGRSRRISGLALQRRSGRESRSHQPRSKKRSAADYHCRANGIRAAPGCAGATSRASCCARKVSDAAEGRCSIKSSCASESNEARQGKNSVGKSSAGEDKLSAAQRIQKFSEARKFATATLRAPRK